jgi:hypothetical protein
MGFTVSKQRDYTTGNDGNPAIPATRSYNRTIGLPYVLGAEMVREIADNIANDIIEDARTVHGPVVWVTGNSYMPPFRSFDMADRVWNAENNDDGELFAFLVETVDSRLQDAHVLLECPEYDNALYVVDLNRWQYREDAAGDDLNDEWEPRTDD